MLSHRFQFFVDKVLPQYRESVMSHTMIYIPSYFDYVRLRNFMKKEEVNFVSLCEYSSKSEVSRARHFFQKGDKQFLLFTERFHYYKRSVNIYLVRICCGVSGPCNLYATCNFCHQFINSGARVQKYNKFCGKRQTMGCFVL